MENEQGGTLSFIRHISLNNNINIMPTSRLCTDITDLIIISIFVCYNRVVSLKGILKGCFWKWRLRLRYALTFKILGKKWVAVKEIIFAKEYCVFLYALFLVLICYSP